MNSCVIYFKSVWSQYTIHHVIIFLLTFFSYANLHLTRKAFANVKTDLFNSWTGSEAYNNSAFNNQTYAPASLWNEPNHHLFASTDDASIFGGLLDTLFLIAYSLGLYINGYLGDIYDPRKVLSVGMLLSSCTVIIFGYVCESLHYYNLYFYAILWILNGLFQSSGWPAAVAIMGYWFGHSRGVVFGIWSNCASVGNVLGDLVVSGVVNCGYQFGLLVPACILLSTSLLIYSGTIVSPGEVPTVPKYATVNSTVINVNEQYSVTTEQQQQQHDDLYDEVVQQQPPGAAAGEKPFGFFKALCIPGVIPYSLAYACLKLVNYAFFFWLPFYLSNAFGWSSEKADAVSVWYDVGGIVGSVLMGLVSDWLWARSPVNMLMLLCALPSLYFYSYVPGITWQNSLVMAMTGFFINVPANLISATIAADLGSNEALSGNDKALSTVTGIIDGTGSLGAAIGQLLVPLLETKFGWTFVFYFFIVMLILTMLCIMPVFVKDVRRRFCTARPAADNVVFVSTERSYSGVE